MVGDLSGHCRRGWEGSQGPPQVGRGPVPWACRALVPRSRRVPPAAPRPRALAPVGPGPGGPGGGRTRDGVRKERGCL